MFGRNPAEAIYHAAKMRGYAAKAPAKPADTANIDKIRAGQKTAKSLSGAGSSVKPTASMEALLADDEDSLSALHSGESSFDAKFAALARQQRRN